MRLNPWWTPREASEHRRALRAPAPVCSGYPHDASAGLGKTRKARPERSLCPLGE
jgi:hypothetical protein